MQTPNNSLLPLWAFLLFALVGCKTSRQVSTMELKGAKETNVFFDSMQKQAFHYETLSARAHIDIHLQGNELSSRIDIKIVKDSILQLSAQPLPGVEVFRLEFGLDSVRVIDRLNKRYVRESYTGMKGETRIDFNFFNLQALFTNRIFLPGEQDVTPSLYARFRLSQDQSVAEAQVTDTRKLLYTFRADGEEKLLSTRIAAPDEAYALQWNYSDFKLEGGQAFPMQMDAQVWNKGSQAGSIHLSFSRIQRNIPLNISFSVPNNYKRITFVEIIKMFGLES
jgi:hypothetical protein